MMEPVLEDADNPKRRPGRFKRVLRRVALGIVAAGVLCVAVFGLLWRVFPFPQAKLQQWPSSPVVLDAKGRTMLRVVGPDEQWRQPAGLSEISPWLVKATIAVEDSRFYRHRGIDVAAVVRAIGQNLLSRRVVSGASTLTMQICRMMDDRPRTLRAKTVESFRALQLERLMTKQQILELYLNVAPYGGNIRGVEAASRVYFGKGAGELCLAEAALIAGLPQSPSRYRPDRHPAAARQRQAVVLTRMLAEGMITQEKLVEALAEPVLPDKVDAVPRAAHAAWLAIRLRPAGGRTTIDLDIQSEVERLVGDHLRQLPADSQVAVVVIDIATSAVKAMVCSADPADPLHGQVNGALALRSPGSALKPFVYAAAFEMRRLNGESLIDDSPIRRAGWTPENFDRQFHGTVTVAQALQMSLNTPAIRTAEGVGLARCCAVIHACGVHLPPDAAGRGGLAIAVGTVETNLLDLTNAYATLGRGGVFKEPGLFVHTDSRGMQALSEDTCRCINDILSCRRRPAAGSEDTSADRPAWFMWKTGTSSGRRDAWAVGHNYRYAVGVWVGRFRGTGRVEYVGVKSAEPLLARIMTCTLLSNSTEPPDAPPLPVRRPLALSGGEPEDLRITTPEDGSEYACLGPTATVAYSANRQASLTWFLNDRLVESDTGRLAVSAGRYTLRCVSDEGCSSSVSFAVVSIP